MYNVFVVVVVVVAGLDFICKILRCVIAARAAWHRHIDAAIDCAASKHGGLFMCVVKVDPL